MMMKRLLQNFQRTLVLVFADVSTNQYGVRCSVSGAPSKPTVMSDATHVQFALVFQIPRMLRLESKCFSFPMMGSISQGARNWPFLTFTGRPVLAAAARRSV